MLPLDEQEPGFTAMPKVGSRLLRRRRVEEAEYWRKRAGWFDDDASMQDYNNGVYDSYYQLDDETGDGQKTAMSSAGGSNSELAIKVGLVIVAIGLCLLMFRSLSRRLSGEKKSSKDKKRSSSKTRGGSRSLSRGTSRSRSRSRKTRGDDDGDDYDLMEEDGDKSQRSKRSNRSSRSKSRRSGSKGRSSSKTRSRSRSKSRTTKNGGVPAPVVEQEPVLV